MIDFSKPHRRQNPLTGEWILVSPHRAKRPWQGTIEQVLSPLSPSYEPNCYLCPNNIRSNGETNQSYEHTYAFTNDHASLLPDGSDDSYKEQGLLNASQERGFCRVICYSPKHNMTMAQLSVDEILEITRTWKSEYETIGSMDQISYVQIFENKGSLMGASSPHPHGQIWATEHLPTIVENEQLHQASYFSDNSIQLLMDYLHIEIAKNERMVMENDSFAVVVPFWATWPYETMVIPKRHIRSLSDMTKEDLRNLSNILKRLTSRYDKIFSTSFPYSMGIHQKPTDDQEHPEWQFHMHFYPPLLRSATVKKYYVGYEMMAEGQRDITPESAAQILKEIHD